MSGILKLFPARALTTAMVLGALICSAPATHPAYAQEGGEASEEITISEDEPGAATETKTEDAAKKAEEAALLKVRPKMTERDPFRNPIASGEVHGTTVRRTPRPASTGRQEPTVKPAEGAAASTEGSAAAPAGPDAPAYGDEEEPEVSPPAVTVTGIISSGSGRRAILTSPDQSYIVSVGDKLAEYRVTAISERAVSFSLSDRTFKLEMEDEFGLHSKK